MLRGALIEPEYSNGVSRSTSIRNVLVTLQLRGMTVSAQTHREQLHATVLFLCSQGMMILTAYTGHSHQYLF